MILFSLNPIKWIKDLLISDYVGGWLRHAVTGLGFILTAHHLGADDAIARWVAATIELVTSSEFLKGLAEMVLGMGGIAGGLWASAANKRD